MKYFKLAEFERQSKIKDEIIKGNITNLVDKVLDKARCALGMPITVTSGYRSTSWELSKGRSGTSQHCKGEAADLKCENNAELFDYIKRFTEFDQLIWELGGDSQPAWVHVSYKGTGRNRMQVLKYDGKKYIQL
jgi:hypothetical protein